MTALSSAHSTLFIPDFAFGIRIVRPIDLLPLSIAGDDAFPAMAHHIWPAPRGAGTPHAPLGEACLRKPDTHAVDGAGAASPGAELGPPCPRVVRQAHHALSTVEGRSEERCGSTRRRRHRDKQAVV